MSHTDYIAQARRISCDRSYAGLPGAAIMSKAEDHARSSIGVMHTKEGQKMSEACV